MSLTPENGLPSTAAPDNLEARLLSDGEREPGRVLQKKAEDTSAGCRGRAAESMVAAAAMDTVNGRVRMEASAATWTARADLLKRLELKVEARETAVLDGSETDLEQG